MNDRYKKNFETISKSQQETLLKTKVLVIGLGGLGGLVIEGLARIGVNQIGVCDYDKFVTSNLNRQLLCTEENINQKKVEVAKTRINKINSEIIVNTYEKEFGIENKLLMNDFKKYDVIIDCLDNCQARILLEEICVKNNKTMIYGAIGGKYGYIGVVNKDNKIINLMCSDEFSLEKQLGNPFYTPATIASLQVLLFTKYVLKETYLHQGFYCIDLENITIDEVIIK